MDSFLMRLSFKIFLFFGMVLVASADEYHRVDATVHSGRVKRNSENLLEALVLTDDEKGFFTDEHNRYRRMQTATNMRLMEWNETLAQFAQTHTENCDFAHSIGSGYGENLYTLFSSAEVRRNQMRGSTQSWYSEIEFYDFELDICAERQQCGHYTQMVWHSSYRVGCGASICASNLEGFPQQIIVSCNYEPPGNFVGQQPYEAGENCANCQSDNQIEDICVDGLCANPLRNNLADILIVEGSITDTQLPTTSASTTVEAQTTLATTQAQATTSIQPSTSPPMTTQTSTASAANQPSTTSFETTQALTTSSMQPSTSTTTTRATTMPATNSQTQAMSSTTPMQQSTPDATSTSSSTQTTQATMSSRSTTVNTSSMQSKPASTQDQTTTVRTPPPHTSRAPPSPPSTTRSFVNATSPTSSSTTRSTTTETPTTSTPFSECNQLCQCNKEQLESFKQWKEDYADWKKIFDNYNEKYGNSFP